MLYEVITFHRVGKIQRRERQNEGQGDRGLEHRRGQIMNDLVVQFGLFAHAYPVCQTVNPRLQNPADCITHNDKQSCEQNRVSYNFV